MSNQARAPTRASPRDASPEFSGSTLRGPPPKQGPADWLRCAAPNCRVDLHSPPPPPPPPPPPRPPPPPPPPPRLLPPPPRPRPPPRSTHPPPSKPPSHDCFSTQV